VIRTDDCVSVLQPLWARLASTLSQPDLQLQPPRLDADVHLAAIDAELDEYPSVHSCAGSNPRRQDRPVLL